MSPILAGAIAAAALVLVLTVSTYNRLIRLRNGTENSFGALDAQLKNRFDLVPNVVAAVGSYMKHERTLLESLTSLRPRWVEAGAGGLRTGRIGPSRRFRRERILRVFAAEDLVMAQIEGSWIPVLLAPRLGGHGAALWLAAEIESALTGGRK
jgi:hypothetical protein